MYYYIISINTLLLNTRIRNLFKRSIEIWSAIGICFIQTSKFCLIGNIVFNLLYKAAFYFKYMFLWNTNYRVYYKLHDFY